MDISEELERFFSMMDDLQMKMNVVDHALMWKMNLTFSTKDDSQVNNELIR